MRTDCEHMAPHRIIKTIRWMLLYAGLAQAQSLITGQVTDADTKAPLPGVNIQVLATLRGGITNVDGNFRITDVPPGAYTIRFSMIGYHSLTVSQVNVTAAPFPPLKVALRATAIEMDPMVVSAGKTK
ncbi:MAG TPA: carboxypeptidase-like regulatory domain-containing protein, partial [bacterium]|nr:carboxypeptidase-like regulatory domain-containing protein [bacterium]